nr:MAG TPA: hypothetical protein [Caudoviricetes sp.]
MNGATRDGGATRKEERSDEVIITKARRRQKMKVYDGNHPYDGKDFSDLLQALSPGELKKVLKSAYRKVGKEVRDVARQAVRSSGLHDASRVARAVRLRIYPRGGGFMVTVKPHGKQGFTKNRKGFEKPIAMWAAEGTNTRLPRKGPHYADIGGGRVRKIDYMGRMPAYDFLKDVEKQGGAVVERELGRILEDALPKE